MPAYKDEKRNRWYVKFKYKDWTGTRKDVTKRGFLTKRDALQWEREFMAQKSGSLDVTFATFVKTYRGDREPRLKESTVMTKDNIIDKHILPYFGKRALRDITSSDVIKWQNAMLAFRDEQGKPYSKSYLKTVHNQLSAIFNHAVRFYKLPENPARIAGNMGTERGIQMQFWTKEQYLKFAEAAMDCPLAYYCFEVLYWGGIREGELLALTPADFDFESQQMSISKTYHMLNGKEYITEPKTPKSIRKVHMPDFLVEEIKDFMEMQYGLKSTDRLFPTGKSFLYRMMEKYSKEAGVPKIRIHDLRHSHVSLLIDMGFSAVAIAERMGHESIDITYRYAHLFPSVQTEMASKLNGMREGGDGNVGEE